MVPIIVSQKHTSCYTQLFRKTTSSTWIILVQRVIAIAIAISSAIAQQQQSPTKRSSDKVDKANTEHPLELPEFIITGTEVLDVPGATKQFPMPLPKLTQQDIRRLNPIEKTMFSMLPFPSVDIPNLEKQTHQGFLRSEFGMFVTPHLEASRRIIAGNFDMNARLLATHSQGHMPQADFTELQCSLHSQYLAPEKFLFFGGSRTDAYLRCQYRDYRFFAVDSLYIDKAIPTRSVVVAEAGVHTAGTYEAHIRYSMGASIETAFLAGRHRNTVVSGHMTILTPLTESWNIGGKLFVQGQAVPNKDVLATFFLAPMLQASYHQTQLTLKIESGIHAAAPRVHSSTVRPAASVQASFALNHLLTLEASLSTGLRTNSFLQALRLNPYTADSAEYFVESVQYDIRAYARLYPARQWSVVFGVNLEQRDAALLFGRLRQQGDYIQSPLLAAHIVRFVAEADIVASSNDKLAARTNIAFGSTWHDTIPTLRFSVPYLAPLTTSITYHRQWSSHFSTLVEGVFVSERSWLDIQPLSSLTTQRESGTLPAYFDLRCSADYQLSTSVSAYIRGTNLLNQPIILWQGYRERGIFLAAGFILTF
ncbi:MAG: hypothetical protein RML40_10975 [Bacteroidota bacterium]|nr:hypothetical protein [Candidatus Kapabacteria bacterium]MDW8221037.1 hypothetical protein [Bacteroidota bacterium]